MHIIIMLSAHGFGIQEVQDSNPEGMELQFICQDKYSQASSCVLREGRSTPLTSTVEMMDALCEKVNIFPPEIFAYLVNQTWVWFLV